MLSLIRRVFPRTMPVLAGYIFLGIAYGAAMNARGLAPGWSALISVIVYGGSLQFALIDCLTRSFAPLTIAALALLIQARHLFYSLSMLDSYQGTGWRKPYLIFSLTDETYSLVCNGAPAGEDAGRWFTAVSLLDQSYWVAGTILGALMGSLLPTEALRGIDFSMTALFTVIATDQTMDAVQKARQGEWPLREALFAPLLGGLMTLTSLLIAGQESFLLLAMAGMLLLFYARWRTLKGKEAAA
ncbi:MAG: AzlC family ABC transporter permease [Clostridia bacterium]|nr:AzlC family ABC transporter permease [Clostridia bacterium]